MRFLLISITFFIASCCVDGKIHKNEYSHLTIDLDSKILNQKYSDCLNNYRDSPVDFFGFEEAKYNYMIDSTTLLLEKGKSEDEIIIKFGNSFTGTTFLRKQDELCLKNALMNSIGKKHISKMEVKLYFRQGEVIKIIGLPITSAISSESE
jgi:hypothetical protein